MKKVIFLKLIVLVILLSCKKENGDVKENCSEVILSSKLYGSGPYFTYGFSFSEGKLLKYPGSEIIVDITILAQVEVDGSVSGGFLDSPNIKESFNLTAEFSTADSALNYFNNYSLVVDSAFVEMARPLKGNQIWTIRTRHNKYAKILILSVLAYLDEENIAYAQTTFKWCFQSDGSKNLDL